MPRHTEKPRITSQSLAPGYARLMSSNGQESVYMLDATYEDDINKVLKPQPKRISTVYYKNGSKIPSRLVTVRYQQVDKKQVLCYAPTTVTFTTDEHTKEKVDYGQWQKVEEPDSFSKYHNQHLILRAMHLLRDSEPVAELERYKQKLLMNMKMNDKATKEKLQAMDIFLRAIRGGDSGTFYNILYSPKSSVFSKMVKPRLTTYNFFFFSLDFQARDEKETVTYKLLMNIKKSEEAKNVLKECNLQENYPKTNIASPSKP